VIEAEEAEAIYDLAHEFRACLGVGQKHSKHRHWWSHGH
jgi:hypothetical protein